MADHGVANDEGCRIRIQPHNGGGDLAKGLTPDTIIQPVLDGYEAKVKVFNERLAASSSATNLTVTCA